MRTFLRLALPFVLGLVVLTASSAVLADEESEDDGRLIARFFDVEALTMGRTDFIPEQLRLISPDMVSDEDHPLFGAEAEEPTLPVGAVDELVELIQQNVDPVSWQITPGADMASVGEHSLLVQATAPVMEKVARYLADLESEVLTSVTLEVRTVSVDRPTGSMDAATLLRTGEPGPAVVLTALVGQRATAYAGSQTTYVQDYDVEVAEESKDSDPIVGVSNHGMVVAVQSRLGNDRGRIRVDLDATLVRLLAMRDHTTYEDRTIQLPSVETVGVHSQLLLEPGVWHVGEGRTHGRAQGRWLFLVRATALSAPSRTTPAPALYDPHARADKGPLVTRTYDVSDLYAPKESFLGRSMFLLPSNFTPLEPPELPEPMPVVAIDTVAELLPTLVVPGSWKRDGTSIQAWNGRLSVTNTAMVLDQVERALQALRRQFLWTIALDVDVVEVDVALGRRLVAPTPTGAGYLLSGEERALIEAAIAATEAERVDRVRVVSLAGTRNAVVSGREFAYVQDYEIEIAKGSSIANPVVRTCLEGVVADLRPALTTTRDAVNLTARVTRAQVVGERQVSTPHGPLDSPQLDITRMRSNLRVPIGETAVVGVDVRGERALVVLVTARFEARTD